MNMRHTTVVLAILMLAQFASAKNVDLVTLPKRNTVELTIYNSADITLAKETRNITVKKGDNQIQFSWAGTLIDPSSVEMRVLEHAEEIEIADTVFPGQKPQHLIWNIESEFEGQVPVEVSYFTSGLTWQMDYVAITDPDEELMKFRGYVRVFNNSGEEYENAHIRLIVGKINLVEKIADLARRWGSAMPEEKEALDLMEQQVMLGAIATAEASMDDEDDNGRLASKKQIVKEGLSEYFMFSVQGSETIKNGWSKRMEAVNADDVKFDILYRMRTYQYGPRPVRFFIWLNDEEHRLGESPLPDGQVRMFRENGKGGLSFLGQQLIRYVPIKAELEINLGTDDLVVYETFRKGTKRDNFSFRRSGNREYVDGWDERTRWVDSVRNYRTKPIKFELRRRWPGHIDYASEIKSKLFDYRTIETAFGIAARGKELYPCMVVTHNGVNKKQERIELKQ